MTLAAVQPSDLKYKVQKLREIYADATEVSKAALENVIHAVQSGSPGAESNSQLKLLK